MARPEPERGEIWWVDWSPGRGSEQTGRRPAIVVQTDAANRQPRYPNTIVVTVSAKGRSVPFHVPLAPSAANGLSAPSFAKCEQLLTISKERLRDRVGRLSTDDLTKVGTALRLALDL